MKVLGPSDAVTISDDVFRQLFLATSGSPVCPNLQRLTWTSLCGWENMQHFFSPRLVTVLFRQRQRHQPPTVDLPLASTISLLPTAHLEELRLDNASPLTPPTKSALSEVVQQLNSCFRHVSTRSSLTDPAWEHLASLPKLESFWVYNTPSTKISSSIPHELTFPALKSMGVVVDDKCQHWLLLFPLFKSSPLRQITVVAGRGIGCGDVPGQVTLAMLGSGLQRSVNDLTITGFDPAHLAFISHLGPFSYLRTLECITRCRGSGQCESPLTDPDIEKLASALPRLVTLCLGHRCEYSPPHTTIKSMMSLSTHCLSLETLYLPCDLSNIAEDVKMESGEPDPRLEIRSLCPLGSLLFQCTVMPPAEDLEASRIAVSALRHLFPRLEPNED